MVVVRSHSPKSSHVSNSCSWAASHASCVTQHIILTQDICNSYNRLCNPKYTKAFNCFPPQSFVWRREQWWLQCVARRPRYVVECEAVRNPLLSLQEDFSDAERAAALQLPLKSHSITAPPTSTSTHFSSNSLKLYFLRPDRLFRDPGVIIK